MDVFRYIVKGLNHLSDRIFSVTGALLFSQIPVFIMQYVNTLSGALTESSKQIDSLKLQAKMLGCL